jgi:hypothetical protein
MPSNPPPVPVSKSPARYDDEDDEPLPRRRYEDDDDDDDLHRSIRRPPRRRESSGLSLTAMILGITGLLFLVGSIAVVFLGLAAAGAAQNPGACCCGFIGSWGGLLVSGILGLLGTILGFVGLSRGAPGFAWTGICTGIATVLGIILYLVLTVVLMMLGVAAIGAAAQQQNNFGPPPRPR